MLHAHRLVIVFVRRHCLYYYHHHHSFITYYIYLCVVVSCGQFRRKTACFFIIIIVFHLSSFLSRFPNSCLFLSFRKRSDSEGIYWTHITIIKQLFWAYVLKQNGGDADHSNSIKSSDLGLHRLCLSLYLHYDGYLCQMYVQNIL